jgi:thiamine biosynthesis lipoprotein
LRQLVWLVGLGLLAGCSPPSRPVHEQIYIFGTLVDVTVRGVPEKTARQAIAAVAEDFRWMHREWHAWKPGGALYDLNQAIAEGRTVEVSDRLLPLLSQARDLSHQSEGLFNPAIGGLIGLWGFHADERPDGPPPGQDAIHKLVEANPTMDDLVIDGHRVGSRNPAVQLDLGAFAKGVAVDMAIRRLREFGIDNAIVNGGGDLRAIGDAGGRPWRIGIRHPQGQGVVASLETHGDESVFTSGNYERYHEFQGVRYAHIIDPRDGMPVSHIASATVVYGNGGVADAAATALTVAGPDQWVEVARSMGLHQVMLVDENGTVYMTPKMAARIHFEGDRPEHIVLSEDI